MLKIIIQKSFAYFTQKCSINRNGEGNSSDSSDVMVPIPKSLNVKEDIKLLHGLPITKSGIYFCWYYF